MRLCTFVFSLAVTMTTSSPSSFASDVERIVDATGANHPQPSNVVTVSLSSSALNRLPEVKIIVPDTYLANKEKTQALRRYPVIYVLDGEANYALVNSMLKRMALSGDASEYLVVSLESQDRLDDFAPVVNLDRRGPYGKGGGGDAFLDFMQNELMPYLQVNFQANEFAAIIGHSVGGLLVYHSFYSRPQLFDAHIAFSPAVWWGEQKTLNNVKKYVYSSDDIGSFLYTNIGNEGGMMRDHYDSLIDTLLRNRTSDLVVQSETYPLASHGATFAAGLYSALHGLNVYYQKSSAE